MARFAILALGALGVALILLLGDDFSYARGGMIWDSAYYVSAARNLAAGEGFVVFDGRQYSDPPLFPLLMATGVLVGIDAVDAARYVNAAAFGLTVFTVAAWLIRHVRSPLLAVWAGCACACSISLASAAVSIWTEIIFVLFIVVSLSRLDRFLSRPTAPALLLAAAAAAAACLTRYAGAPLIGAGALILLLRNDTGMRDRLRDTALWSAVSLAPIASWAAVIRSPAVASDVGISGLYSLHEATGKFVLWLFGPTGFDLLNGTLGRVTGIDLAGITVTAIAVKSVLLAVAALGSGYALARYRPGFLQANRTPLTVAAVFAAAYVLFLVMFLPLRGITLTSRYLLPLFPPLLVVATLVLDGFVAKGSFKNAAAAAKIGLAATAVPVVVAIVTSLWLVQQVGATYRATKDGLHDIPGFVESDFIRYLSTNRLDGYVWTNHAPVVFFFTEHRYIGSISGSLAEIKNDLANWRPAESVYVVLFEWDGNSDAWATLPSVELVADLDAGVIFHRRPAVPASSADLPASSAEDRVVRAHFDIHAYEDALVYFKEPCTKADVQADFFLHVIPIDAANLSAAARAEGSVFNSLDFAFAERGVIQDGRCLAVVTLDYEIMQFHTGQFRPGHPPFWEVTTTPGPE